MQRRFAILVSRVAVGAVTAEEGDEQRPAKIRRTGDTVEPLTWHGTSPQVWDEILNIAGANNATPKLVAQLVATDDILSFKCLQKRVPHLGICFNDFHRNLLRTRLVGLLSHNFQYRALCGPPGGKLF